MLLQTATWEEIQALYDDAVRFGTASVCIPQCYVRQAADYRENCMKESACGNAADNVAADNSVADIAAKSDSFPVICTVIGFPNGNMTTASKCFETKDALENGAEEIDMVINIGWAKAGLWDQIEEEIRQVKAICGEHILKVIIETCLLTEEEKISLCGVVSRSGADYIKTSTGFSTAGATFSDVELFAAHVDKRVKIKAAGGISSFADAERFIGLGADRLGTSRLVKIAKTGV